MLPIKWIEGRCVSHKAGSVTACLEDGRRFWLARYKLSSDEFSSAEEGMEWIERKSN